MKLSFIVPIYNVEPYLLKCVDSLLHQDYEDYEIILVDDGSTDGSGDLADEIVENWELRNEKRETRVEVRVIHQENRGLSGARNTGISAAMGAYICFVDSDDYWEENVLGGLMVQIERDNLDVLRFRYQNVTEDGDVFKPNKDPQHYDNFSENPIDGTVFLNERMGQQCYVTAFVIKRTLLVGKDGNGDSNSCLFMEGILFEDTDWTPRMLMRAKRVASTKQIVYNYLWRTGSITLATNLNKIRKGVDDRLRVANRLIENCGEQKWTGGMIAIMVASILSTLASTGLYAERGKYIRQIKEMNVLPLSLYHVGPATAWKIRLINVSPTLFLWLLRINRIIQK